MISYVYIVPSADAAEANAMAEANGYGPRCFSVPLADGIDTYLGACSFVDLLIPAPTTWMLTFNGIVSVSETETPKEHWYRVLAENGLHQPQVAPL